MSVRRAARSRRDWVMVSLWLSLVLSAAAWSMPFAFMFFTSVKTPLAAAEIPAWLPPESWEWGNYSAAIEIGRLWTSASNSFVVSILKVPLGLLVGALAAFALSRIPFRGSRLLVGLFVVGAMIPVQIALGPLFNTMLALDLLDSKLALVIPYVAFGAPHTIFILFGFFRAVPQEVEEAARIDGASTWMVFWRIMLPLSRPALAALFILDFVSTWNEYAIARTLLQSAGNWTIPLAVQAFSTDFSTDYGALNAFIILTVIPVLIVYLMFQRYFVAGIFAGSVKG